MAEFKKLSEVSVLEEVAESAQVLAEINGEIYRVPKSAVGGSQGMVVELTAEEVVYDN